MKQNEYLKKLNQKYNDQIREKQMELNNLQETQRQNAEYEQMMAARKIQNRAQFRQDIDQQIEFKNMEMVSELLISFKLRLFPIIHIFLKASKADQDRKLRQQMEALDEASNRLTEKLLNEGIESVLPAHPFYHCMKK